MGRVECRRVGIGGAIDVNPLARADARGGLCPLPRDKDVCSNLDIVTLLLNRAIVTVVDIWDYVSRALPSQARIVPRLILLTRGRSGIRELRPLVPPLLRFVGLVRRRVQLDEPVEGLDDAERLPRLQRFLPLFQSLIT